MIDLAEWPLGAKAALVTLVAAALVAVWSVLASTIFLAGTGMIGQHHGLPFVEWWLYWWFYGFAHPAVGLWLKLAAGVSIGVPLLLIGIGLARRGLPGSNRLLHGSTQWAGRGELRENGLLAGFGGLYLGKLGSRRYLRFNGPEHVACYAPTRSGKGVGLVIPNCLLYEASLVCLDVKKENWAASAGIRARAGQRVYLFDPLSPDGRTARYNPLSYVRRGTIDAIDDIQRIAGMLFPEEQGNGKFFADSARSAFIGATAYLAETEGSNFCLGSVLRLFTRTAAAAEVLDAMGERAAQGKPYSEPCMTALEDYLSGNADTVADIRKTVTSKLNLWINPRIDAATSESDFDLRDLRRHLCAIYVGVTPDNIARLQPLLSLFFQQLVDLTVQVLPQFDPKAKHQVLMLLDEFPLLGPMPVLANAFSYVAGYNIRMMLVMQSKAQLRDPALYGPDKATAILDNCGVEVVFGTKNNELAKELSDRLGNETVSGISRSGPRFWRAFRSKAANQTESDQARPLLLPQEILMLKQREAIVLRAAMHPCKVRRIRYFKDRFFRRLVVAPPAVQPIEIVNRVRPSLEGKAAPQPTAIPGASPPAAAIDEARPAPTTLAPVKKAASKDKAKPKTSAGEVSEDVGALPASCATGQPAATSAAPPAPAPADAPALRPHQANGLVAGLMGANVDLSQYALKDGKAVLASLLDGVPTVASIKRRSAAA